MAEHSALVVVGILFLGGVLSVHTKPQLLGLPLAHSRSRSHPVGQNSNRRSLMSADVPELAKRRQLLILDQVFGGGPRFVSANDAIFNVLRGNK
eukprot:scaffold190731_cov23-Prasinocladus_malaysianus.AAC.1